MADDEKWWGDMLIMWKWELTIGSILQVREWDAITIQCQKFPFFMNLVYLVLKRGKITPNKCPFKSNLRVGKWQFHLEIFSIFDNKSKKSLTKTHSLSSPI